VSAIATESFEEVFGARSMDVDSHEMVPFHMWAEHFGEEIAEALQPFGTSPRATDNGLNTIVRPDILADDTLITEESVWHTKGASAPGAFDMHRRLEVMDMMKVDRSLLFPSFGLIGIRMASSPELAASGLGLPVTPAEARDLGFRAMEAFNGWALRSQREVGPRLRPVGVMLTENLDQMLEQLESLIASGIRAIWIPNSSAPADTSPADTALDPFWRMAADAEVPVLLHIGTDFSFPSSTRWTANVPSFAIPSAAEEFPVSAFTGATVNFASENYIAAMVLGGVFERVPNLRFGAIEVGAVWLGPLAERLDLWAHVFRKRIAGVISMKPSAYMARNVRVTPFSFEPIDTYFDRFEAVHDCFCFSTDYPHVEGGVDIKAKQLLLLERHGEEIGRKFFRSNGEWLLP
jgi:predicted TIM-barrel fold metal-dependent hydrolase